MHWIDTLNDLTNLRAHWADAMGYTAAILTMAASSRTTMIPLRALAISSNCFGIIYGIFAPAYPPLVLNAVLLPLNAARLYQMYNLVVKVKAASKKDLFDVDWLKPYMSRRIARAGEIIFRSGDHALDMYYTVTGRYRLVEIHADVAPGQLIGELGLVSPNGKRTLTFECLEDGELLAIGYSQVKELYFQNPGFGYYFLQLIGQRLFRDIARLQEKLAIVTSN